MYIVVVIDRLKGKPLLIGPSEAILNGGGRSGGGEIKEASVGSSVVIFKFGAHQLYHDSTGHILRLDTVFTN